jgi:hypothetical protein
MVLSPAGAILYGPESSHPILFDSDGNRMPGHSIPGLFRCSGNQCSILVSDTG